MAFLDVNDGEIEDLLQELDESDPAEDDAHRFAKKTNIGRDHALKSFWKHSKDINADQIWIDLCGSGPKQLRAINCCKTFLFKTAMRTKRLRVILGAEEKEAKRTMNHASSLVALWKSVVMAFNGTVLAQKRQEDPQNAARWNLKFGTGIRLNRGIGPVAEITEWIGIKAPKMGLRFN